MSRTPLIAGNWKMYKTIPEALALVKALLPHLPKDREVAVAPPFTALYSVASCKRHSIKISRPKCILGKRRCLHRRNFSANA